MSLFRRFLDRRKRGGPVPQERRMPSMHDADEMLAEAIANMERTSIRRSAFSSHTPANDVQRVVIFSTFAEQCEYRLVTPKYQVCKHKEHEGAGTGIAPCAESACPFMREPK